MTAPRAALDQALLATPLDPASCVFRSVSRVARLVAGVYDRAFAPVGLTAGQFNLLMTLARLGTISVSGLAAQLSADSSTIPRLLAPLVAAGQISVSRGRDRRVRMLSITARGCSRLRAALPRWHAAQAELVGRLADPNWDTLRKSLRALRLAAHATVH